MITNKINIELIKRLKKGDMDAFDSVYRAYSKKVYGYIFRYLKHDMDTEDIVQEVFLKIWEMHNSIDVKESFDAYIFTITHNLTINYLRKKVTEQKYVEYVTSLQKEENVYEITDEIHYREMEQKYRSLLNKLSPRQQEIFRLSREKGLSHKEIAAKLNISPNTVNNHLVAILSFFKKNLPHLAALFTVKIFF